MAYYLYISSPNGPNASAIAILQMSVSVHLVDLHYFASIFLCWLIFALDVFVIMSYFLEFIKMLQSGAAANKIFYLKGNLATNCKFVDRIMIKN